MKQIRFVLPLAAVIGAIALFSAGGQRGSAITADCFITVDSTGDDTADNMVVTLREAILFATNVAEPGFGEVDNIAGCGDPSGATQDVILFDAGVYGDTISLGLGLPALSTGGDEVDGTGAGMVVDGVDDTLVCFAINSSGNRIRGLQVEDCLVAIWIDGTGGDVNYNTIGGSMAGEGNVLRGNGTGLKIEGVGASGNVVQGNFIGTDATGAIAAGNGVGVVLDDAPWNTVGGSMLAMTGAAPGGVIPTGMEGNVISGNTGTGVVISGESAANNIVQSNYIGTDVLGLADLGNGGDGVLVFDAPSNWVGPASIVPLGIIVPPGVGNVISGNDLAGVEISGTSATSNVVRSNMIGTDYSGGSAIGNGVNGVRIAGAPGNRVGGTGYGDGNVISGNGDAGVAIFNSDASEVQGNRIGTDSSGYSAVANLGPGVMISDAPGNTIGGAEAGAMNIISGNQTHGVLITGAPSIGNVVQGNSVGVAADGLSPLGNGFHGVLAQASGPNAIGGRNAGEGNEIAFNGMDGVAIVAVPVISTNKPILGNSIHDNTGLGIDLGDNGIDLNDAGDPDTGANGHQNYPVLTSAAIGASTTIAGTLNSTASTGFFIDFYASDLCDPLLFGEGAGYLGSAVVTTDAAGNAAFNSTVAGTAIPGQRVTATATDPGNNTSEFSACVDVTGGETPTPTPEPTATPTPTPEPTATATPVPRIQGDTDCDEDVDSVDALWVLKRSAGMEPYSACIDQGDIQCDLDIDSVDSLGILRHVAALPALAQTEPCTDIGLPL